MNPSRRIWGSFLEKHPVYVLGLPSLQKCVCEIFGEIWFGIWFEIWNFRWEKSGEIFGEDFSTCQESTEKIRGEFRGKFRSKIRSKFRKLRFQISRLLSETSFSRRAVLNMWCPRSWGHVTIPGCMADFLTYVSINVGSVSCLCCSTAPRMKHLSERSATAPPKFASTTTSMSPPLSYALGTLVGFIGTWP